MKLHISPGDGAPIYLQIMRQLKFLIASKRLRPGDELPPIRTLAQDLLINPNTVARAYRELERDGLLASRQGQGTTVADGASPLARAERRRILDEQVTSFLTHVDHLGFSLDEVHDRIDEKYREMHGAPGAHEPDKG